MGTLYLKSDMGAIYERFRSFGLIAVLVLVLACGVAYAISTRLQRKISQPILALTETAAHGRWQVDAHLDPKGEAVGHVEFEVQDFVPQRLKVELTATAPAITPGEAIRQLSFVSFRFGIISIRHIFKNKH